MLLGIGLGLLIGFFICNEFIYGHALWLRGFQETAGIIYGASTLLFGGLGLLAAFLIEMKYRKDKKRCLNRFQTPKYHHTLLIFTAKVGRKSFKTKDFCHNWVNWSLSHRVIGFFTWRAYVVDYGGRLPEAGLLKRISGWRVLLIKYKGNFFRL